MGIVPPQRQTAYIGDSINERRIHNQILDNW